MDAVYEHLLLVTFVIIFVLFFLEEISFLIRYAVLEASINKLLDCELLHIDHRHMIVARHNQEWEIFFIEFRMWFQAKLLDIGDWIL